MIKFSTDECKTIRDYSNTIERTPREDDGRGISYDFYSIGYNENTSWIFERLNKFFTFSTGIKVVENLDAIHLFKYNVGNEFSRHKDIYYPGQVWNIGACMNDEYEGGDFVLYNPLEVLRKKTGAIYTFRNNREHEVKQILSGNRWSIIGFYFYRHLNINPPVI